MEIKPPGKPEKVPGQLPRKIPDEHKFGRRKTPKGESPQPPESDTYVGRTSDEVKEELEDKERKEREEEGGEGEEGD